MLYAKTNFIITHIDKDGLFLFYLFRNKEIVRI